ncbi:MAG: hypothetical protein ACRETQ_13195 [Gammaproteobacteria bacterium]
MQISACLLVAALLCPAATLAADPFGYQYVELGYLNQSPQSGATIKGPGLGVAYTIFPDLQVLGGYAHLDAATPISSTSYNDYVVGVRGESSYTDTTDFYTDLLYLNNRQSYLGNHSTDNGGRVALGMRHLFLPWLEFDGSVGHNWLTRSSNDITVGLVINATGGFAVGVNYSHNSATNNTAGLLLRTYF